MIIRIVFTIIVLTTLNMGSAQSLIDAYRYSFQNPTGSARYNAVSGAMSAVGADITLGSHNPAGIAAFWKSELALSGNMSFINSQSELRNAGSSEKSVSYENTINNGGIVFTTYSPNKNWMSKSFSIGYNKLMDFNNEVYFEGQTLGSITERWGALGTGLFPDDLGFLEAGIAYDAGAIYDTDGDALYEYDYFRHENRPLNRSQSIQESGGWNEVAFTFGGNYKNKLLIGLTLGIDFVNYERNKSYSEDNPDQNSIPQFGTLRFQEDLTSSGIGINAKLGALVKITPQVNWSFAVASPTALSLSENFSNRIAYQWNNVDGTIGNGNGDSGESQFDYSFINPWKVSTGVAYILGKKGFVDVEMDYIGYSFSKFEFESIQDRDFEQDLNRKINNDFDNAINFRIGGEYVLSSFRLRAGYHMFGSPLAAQLNTNGFSLGFGYRGENWYLDLSFLNRSSSAVYQPYELLDAVVPVVDVDNKVSNIGLTIGFKI